MSPAMSTIGRRSKRHTRSAMRLIITTPATVCTSAQATVLLPGTETTEWELLTAQAAKVDMVVTSMSVVRSPRHTHHPPLQHQQPTVPSLCRPSPPTLRFLQPPTQCHRQAGEFECDPKKMRRSSSPSHVFFFSFYSILFIESRCSFFVSFFFSLSA